MIASIFRKLTAKRDASMALHQIQGLLEGLTKPHPANTASEPPLKGPDRRPEMLALHDGLHQCVTGDMTVAIESFQRAYILYKQAGDKRSASLAQQAVGLCLDGIQKPDEVRTAYKKAIRLLHLAVMPEEAARLLSKLAHYEFSQGTIREAVRYLDAALGLYREIVNPVGQIETLCQYAALELDGGLRNQAHDHACEALGLVDRVDDVNTYEKLRDRVDRLMVA